MPRRFSTASSCCASCWPSKCGRRDGSACACSPCSARSRCAMSTVVTWLNLDGFRSVLGPDAAARMTDGAVVVSLCAALCVGLRCCRLRLRRGRGVSSRRCSGSMLVVSLAGPLYLRGERASPLRRRERPSAVAACAGAVERARAHDSARRRLARLHRAECGGRPVSEFRPPARQRRGDAPGDAAARHSPRRCGPRSPPANCRTRRACIRRRATWCRDRISRWICCPTSASRRRWCASD